MDLFSLPYAKHRPTSKSGATEAHPRAGTQAARILEHIEAMGKWGATAMELKEATGIVESSTMSARLNSLMKMGKIKDSGNTRQGVGKAKQIVWVAMFLTACAPMPDALTDNFCVWADPTRECAIIDVRDL